MSESTSGPDNDSYNLERFVLAQNEGGTFERAASELESGHKASHWMWFVFPQITGLGHSPTARRYALSSLEEAVAYGQHAVLGPRLLHTTGLVAGTVGRSAEQIFGSLDAQKLHSSMTLFQRAAPDQPLFAQVLDRYFDGQPDSATIQRI